jgi:hypothetical protein
LEKVYSGFELKVTVIFLIVIGFTMNDTACCERLVWLTGKDHMADGITDMLFILMGVGFALHKC